MIKLNQIKIGTIVYDEKDRPLRVVSIRPKNAWWEVLCETTDFGGWQPPPRLVNEYGLLPYKRYWAFSLEALEQLRLNRRHAYEVE